MDHLHACQRGHKLLKQASTRNYARGIQLALTAKRQERAFLQGTGSKPLTWRCQTSPRGVRWRVAGGWRLPGLARAGASWRLAAPGAGGWRLARASGRMRTARAHVWRRRYRYNINIARARAPI